MNEAGSVQRPAVTGRKVAPRNAAKLIVNVRYQLIERLTSTGTNPLIYLDSRFPRRVVVLEGKHGDGNREGQ